MVKSINMVLKSCGLALDTETTRDGKPRVRHSTYRLDRDKVAIMVELVKLKTRSLTCPVVNTHARAALAACVLPTYGHLVAPLTPATYKFEPELM